MISNQILLIEDDLESIELIKEYLDEYGYKIDYKLTVTEGLSSLNIKEYDLILLDINLPDYYGFEVLKQLQIENTNIPVIVISAYSDRKTKLHSFKLGASDYMTKPIDLEELEARIRVHLRYKNFFNTPISNETAFNIENHTIFFKNEALQLTKIEYSILEMLIKQKNQIITRVVLAETLSSISSERSLDYHIRNIRRKIDDNGSNPKYIITEYGIGYKLIDNSN